MSGKWLACTLLAAVLGWQLGYRTAQIVEVERRAHGRRPGRANAQLHGVDVPHGALYYGQRHRRVPVEFTTALRTTTAEAAAQLRTLITQGKLPEAEPGPKCRDCSLRIECQPVTSSRQAERYVAALYAQATP